MGAAPPLAVVAGMDQRDYDGFSITPEVDIFRKTVTFAVHVGGAPPVAITLSQHWFESTASDFFMQLGVSLKLIEVAERVWSRWMAL